MLDVNALGDIKLKPLLIYHSQTLRAVREYSEQLLHIIWRLTQRAWTKRDIFQEWFSKLKFVIGEGFGGSLETIHGVLGL